MALVAEWYSVATGGQRVPDSPFFRFLALWVAFNGLYSLKFSQGKTEKAQIGSFARWPRARKAHAELLTSDESSYRAAIATLGQQGVYNYHTGETEQLADENSLPQVIELAYRVRCNLFHGRKVPSNLRDRRLVEAAYVIVSELLSRLIQPLDSQGKGVFPWPSIKEKGGVAIMNLDWTLLGSVGTGVAALELLYSMKKDSQV